MSGETSIEKARQVDGRKRYVAPATEAERQRRLKARRSREERMAEIAEREYLARHLEAEGVPSDPMQDSRVRQAGTHDPLHRFILGGDAEVVLTGVRSAEGRVTMTGARKLETPLDFLRFRSKHPISAIQYEAGLRYGTALSALQRTGSNTQAILNNAVYEARPSAEERERQAWGHEMTSKGGLHPARDPSDSILAAVAQIKLIEQRLSKFDRAVLRQLIGNERTVGQIASVFGCPPDAMGWVVRIALLHLVDALLVADPEFYLFREQTRGE